ncbi:MAG: hypothetical protein MUF18_05650 [Fimbriiglobus sp.]|jgi:hypothetical protein|nr:hypothetical protein [Fimbriiglobus sp.]
MGRGTGVVCGIAAGLGVGVGAVVAVLALGREMPVKAASNDRYDDYVMATGAVNINPKIQADGVWLLDYKSGKLLATVIDKAQGKIVGWAEVDLVGEFELAPKADVHFLMTTGWVSAGQSALYLAETSTGKFGVYTMAAGPTGGVVVRRHDMSTFRPEKPAVPVPGAGVGGALPAGPQPIAPGVGLPPVVPAAGAEKK